MALRVSDQVHLNTPDDVEETVRLAVNVANQAGLEGADRMALLPGIFEQLASKQVLVEQVGIAAASVLHTPGDGRR